uniref:Predicted nucleic acid-binding protein, contains PIN domain n=1 Tax=Candidatus Kentrum sp. SD TaxID=2126332 RepID=A0A450YEN9_9GAMM|nr:MAG: Predicted nucleic acid-binding protein, contains PIN domain [Candidatus Kentron sp. SD]VFK45163.1 MAG: Predicted nucleic acid-binding protein, contains PIN domain [Candidatus Kentron sp. SD]VFK79358.1 MAG: Predicted nucleic acid-binding protein, contains PIN domain [Candidatus Kentron sp. SD]
MVDFFVAEQPSPWNPAPPRERAPDEHGIILLDSCIWIYFFEDHPRYAGPIATLLTQWIERGAILLSSELSLLEIKTLPLRLGKKAVVAEYQLYLNNFPGLLLVPVERAILNRAANLRARYRLKTPDAIILATGLERGATRAFTNDRGWKSIEGMEVVRLSDFTEESDAK